MKQDQIMKFFFASAVFVVSSLNLVMAGEACGDSKCSSNVSKAVKSDLSLTEAGKILSYSEGVRIGQNLAQSKEMDTADFIKGVKIGAEGKTNTVYTQAQIMEAMSVMRAEMSKRHAAEQKVQSTKTKVESGS